MRFLKVILLGLLAALALLAGLFTAVVVAAVTAVKIIGRRLRPQANVTRSSPPPAGVARGNARTHAATTAGHDVIDVVAHEVPASSHPLEK